MQRECKQGASNKRRVDVPYFPLTRSDGAFVGV